MKTARSPRSRTSLFLGAFVVAAVLAVGGYLLLNETDNQASYQGPKEHISIGAGQGAILVWIAQDQGFFADAGLNADIRFYKTGKAASDGLSADEVNVATSAGFILVKNSFQAQDMRAIASIKRGYSTSFIARRDHGIDSIPKLKGKKVGVTLGSAGEFFFGRFLNFNGLELTDVEIVDLNPAGIVKAMVNGEIDAAFTWEPHIYTIKGKLGDKAIAFSAQGKQEFYFLLLAKDGWIQAHPTSVERLLLALLRAEEFARENPQRSRAILVKKFDYDPVYFEYYWSLLENTVELPQSLITLLEDQARWAINNQVVKGDSLPNFLQLLYMKGLESVDLSAITVIR